MRWREIFSGTEILLGRNVVRICRPFGSDDVVLEMLDPGTIILGEMVDAGNGGTYLAVREDLLYAISVSGDACRYVAERRFVCSAEAMAREIIYLRIMAR